MIKVMIVDDHPIVVDGMRQLIEEQADMTVVGTAMSGKECSDMLAVTTPDVLLLDINLPDASGLDICAALHEQMPRLRIIALTGFKEYVYIDGMMQGGASGYLLKNALPDEIAEAVRTVYNGGEYFTEEASAMLRSHREGGNLFLTTRERELLSLVVEGYTNREIADKLFLGVETINSYRKNLLLKLGAKNTAAMVKMAITEKLI